MLGGSQSRSQRCGVKKKTLALAILVIGLRKKANRLPEQRETRKIVEKEVKGKVVAKTKYTLFVGENMVFSYRFSGLTRSSF
jgi:hypothetical protein